MANNSLLINVDIGETRVALIEDGLLGELYVERKRDRSPVGNIYLGKVTRVLPGMQAAFVDVGLDRAAFLHVEDLLPATDPSARTSTDEDASDLLDADDVEDKGAQGAAKNRSTGKPITR